MSILVLVLAGLSGVRAASPTSTIVPLINPIGGTEDKPQGQTDLRIILGNVVKKALTILGSITLLVFVYGGFLWLTSAGNSDRVKTGTQTMIWAALGVFIIFSSYAILSLVISGLGATAPADEKKGCYCSVEGGEKTELIKEATNEAQCELLNSNEGSGISNCVWVAG